MNNRPINKVTKLEDDVIEIRERTKYLAVWNKVVVEWLENRGTIKD